MRIRMPASAGSGICSASGPATMMTTPTMTPEMRFAVRVSAPALTFNAVAESEPAEGAHWRKLQTMFVTPCPVKSRFTSAMVPSRSGIASVTPTAMTSPMMASASDGMSRSGARAMSGRMRAGRPAGMAAMSPTSATPGNAARTRRVATMSGRRRATELRCGTRRMTMTSAIVRRPTASASGRISPA
ncbi:hypothetical protein DSECCO2_364690 [anaerobic digester metagenome]